MLSEGCIGGYCASTAQYQVYENCQMNTRAIARLIVLFTRSSHACGDDQIFRRDNYKKNPCDYGSHKLAATLANKTRLFPFSLD